MYVTGCNSDVNDIISERDESSLTPSPIKASRFNNSSNSNNSRGVNFKNVPEVDHETERMLSGTPVHVHQLRQFQRALDEQQARHLQQEEDEEEEEILAIETTAGRYPMITQVQNYRQKSGP